MALCRFAGVFPLRQPDQNTRVAKKLRNLREISGEALSSLSAGILPLTRQMAVIPSRDGVSL